MPRFEVLPRLGQKFGSRFLLHAHPCSASGTTTSGSRASTKPGNPPKKRVSEGSTELEQILPFWFIIIWLLSNNLRPCLKPASFCQITSIDAPLNLTTYFHLLMADSSMSIT